jgi:hypothetical protein
MSPKELAEKQALTIFENDNVRFIELLGYNAMEYYGSEYLIHNYSAMKGRWGTLYLILDKKGDKNYQIFEPKYGKAEIINFEGHYVDFVDVLKNYPELTSEFIKIVGSETPYLSLLQIKNGIELDEYNLRNADSCFGNIVFNKKRPEKSMIELHFDESEFFKFFKFNIGSEDRNVLNDIFNGDYGYEIYNDDWSYFEWIEGYILNMINDENEKLLNKIINYVSPDILQYQKNDTDKYYQKAANLLYDNFYSKISSIIDNLQEELNENSENSIKEAAIEDIGDPFNNFGIFVKGDAYFNTYMTTVTILLRLFELYGEVNFTLPELFEKLGNDLNYRIGNYYEIGRNTYDFNQEKFQETVKESFDKILEEIFDYPEKYEGTKEYYDIFRELSKLNYEIGEFYDLPNDNTKKFRIQSIDKETNKIKLNQINKTTGDASLRNLTIDEFKNYLYTPELFEQIIRKVKKKL